jgi:hypothetical protein
MTGTTQMGDRTSEGKRRGSPNKRRPSLETSQASSACRAVPLHILPGPVGAGRPCNKLMSALVL